MIVEEKIARDGSAFRVVVWCSITVLITTIHHVRGALQYGTPARYHAIVVAVAALLMVGGAYLAGSRARDPQVRRVAWWIFWLTSAVAFVLAFGVVEGLYTHVIAPLAARGQPGGEPSDLLFQATGVLHVVPATVTAALLARLLRVRRSVLT